MTQWPDTTNQPPPVDHHYASALWLLGRHPQLAELVDRIPDLVHDPDQFVLGAGFLDLDHLAAVVREFDRSMEEARGRPLRAPAVVEFGRMSGTERTRLRLLAFFSVDGVPISASDLLGLDASGQQLAADWCAAITAGGTA